MGYETKPMPTQERLRQLFDYNPDTGDFIRRNPRRERERQAQTGSAKYVMVQVDGVKYVLSRLIWVWMEGEIPPDRFIDHDNLNKRDYRWVNLKCITWAGNQRNTKAKNKTGLPKHVYPARNGRFTAIIRIGTYDTVEEAVKQVAHVTALLHQTGVHQDPSRVSHPRHSSAGLEAPLA